MGDPEMAEGIHTEGDGSSASGIANGNERGRGTGRPAPSPSYAESQFDTIIRRQRIRPHAGALKLPHSKLAPASLLSIDSTPYPPPHLANEWAFSGWGSMSYEDVSPAELDQAGVNGEMEKKKAGEGILGRWMATGVAGVAVAGSPFYAFPAVVSVASVYSPISLLVATMMVSFWRPIMVELASALPMSGANYIYLLNASPTKSLAIFGATMTLLDDVSTAVVSAATAASYVASQVDLGFSQAWLTVIIILGIGLLGLLGVKEGAGVTTGVLAFHLVTMLVLFLTAVVHWGTQGNAILRENWLTGQPGNAAEIAKSIFQGVCLGFLSITGFETTPDYSSCIRPRAYPSVLRNLQWIAVALNAPLMLVTFANLPSSDILGNESVLNTLAQTAAGKWLRIWVSVDAVGILSAGVLTGFISASALVSRLTSDGILPKVFLKQLPITRAPYVSLLFFVALSLVLYASSGASLTIISGMFALCFLSVMALYPLSSLLLTYNRPRLPRSPRNSLLLTLFVFLVSLVLIGGNIALAPATIGYFAAYATVIGVSIWLMSRKSEVLVLGWWILSRGNSSWREKACQKLVKGMKKVRSGAVVVFVETDEINRLFEMIFYVRKNEDTMNVKMVHFYRSIEDIPSELEANYKILDEAFPSITVDLIFVQGTFSPSLVSVVAERLSIPRTLCFMGCPTIDSLYPLGDFGGVRVISS